MAWVRSCRGGALPICELFSFANLPIGGLKWFLATESERFLAFLARRLPDPSHALALCRMAQAIALAKAGTECFVPVERMATGRKVDRGPHASLVWFHADPGAVLAALHGAPFPAIGPPHDAVLFAPGLPGLFRVATKAEVALWERLPQVDTGGLLIETLLMEGVVAYEAAERAAMIEPSAAGLPNGHEPSRACSQSGSLLACEER